MVSFKPSQAKRIVVKLGTQIVMTPEGEVSRERVEAVIRILAKLRGEGGKQILLVSSGAVGLGRKMLKLEGALSLVDQQACAAVGQTLLMETYRRLFGLQPVAQVLTTAFDFSSRRGFLNLRSSLERLIELNVIPVINENDAVSTEELQAEVGDKSFGDNDKLAALVAAKLEADLLIILTDVDGIYDSNPHKNPHAKKIKKIEKFSQLNAIDSIGKSAYGRGGIHSKIEAVRIASLSGVHSIVASGLKVDTLKEIFADENPGSLVLPQYQGEKVSQRKRWIGFSSGFAGILIINDGAVQALQKDGASLLAVGVSEVHGKFAADSTVSIRNEHGFEIGRGLTHFSSVDVNKVIGLKSAEMKKVLGGSTNEIVHRDHLVIFEEFSHE